MSLGWYLFHGPLEMISRRTVQCAMRPRKAELSFPQTYDFNRGLRPQTAAGRYETRDLLLRPLVAFVGRESAHG